MYAVQSTLYRFDGSKKAKNSQARAGHQRSMGGRRSLGVAISFCGHAGSAPRRRVIHHRSRLAQPSRDPPRTDRPPPPRAPAVAPCSPRWGSSLRGATTAGVRMWCPRLINKVAINERCCFALPFPRRRFGFPRRCHDPIVPRQRSRRRRCPHYSRRSSSSAAAPRWSASLPRSAFHFQLRCQRMQVSRQFMRGTHWTRVACIIRLCLA